MHASYLDTEKVQNQATGYAAELKVGGHDWGSSKEELILPEIGLRKWNRNRCTGVKRRLKRLRKRENNRSQSGHRQLGYLQGANLAKPKLFLGGGDSRSIQLSRLKEQSAGRENFNSRRDLKSIAESFGKKIAAKNRAREDARHCKLWDFLYRNIGGKKGRS